MTNGNQPLLSFYEQGMAILTRETELLYQRMSFFLAGMSFLVAAMATMLALHRSLAIPIYAVISLGLALSALFTLASCLSALGINERKSYVCCLERELHPQAPLHGPITDIERLDKGRKGCIDRFFHYCMCDHPASISLIVPEIFVGFWATMLVYTAKFHPWFGNWVWILVIGILVFGFLFIGIHQVWRPWKRKDAKMKARIEAKRLLAPVKITVGLATLFFGLSGKFNHWAGVWIDICGIILIVVGIVLLLLYLNSLKSPDKK